MLATSIKVSWHDAPTRISPTPDSATVVADILAASNEAQLDYADAKLVFDKLIDPSTDPDAALIEIERLVGAARLLAGPDAGPNARLVGLRRLLYEAGPWNDHRLFEYDHSDPLGQSVANKLLATYLKTRRGNCVSMPVLFLILADRLELDVTLAIAPLHILARYRDEAGRSLNIEASNGGQAMRDEWYRQRMNISDRAIERGLYLRSLSRRENVALMATTVLENLLEQRRFSDALAVSDVILRHSPRDGYTMVKQATACGWLLQEEFEQKYRIPALIPPPLVPRYRMLVERNRQGFAAAEALGWEAID